MITEFKYLNGGLIPGPLGKIRIECGGKNGTSMCSGMVISDLGPYLVIRPVTSRGKVKAATFFEIPGEPRILEQLGFLFERLASKRELQSNPVSKSLEDRYLAEAKKLHRDGELELDDNAKVSIGDDPGAYVQFWKWIPEDDLEPDTDVDEH